MKYRVLTPDYHTILNSWPNHPVFVKKPSSGSILVFAWCLQLFSLCLMQSARHQNSLRPKRQSFVSNPVCYINCLTLSPCACVCVCVCVCARACACVWVPHSQCPYVSVFTRFQSNLKTCTAEAKTTWSIQVCTLLLLVNKHKNYSS